jgi:hypothetical protein
MKKGRQVEIEVKKDKNYHKTGKNKEKEGA